MAQKKSKTHLLSIRQGRDETLRQYLARFTEESHKVEGFDDKDAITAITEGVHTSDFLKTIVGKVPRDMAELMTRTRTYMAEMPGSQGGKVVDASTTEMEIVPTLERGGIREARPLTAAPSPGRDRRTSIASESSRRSPP